MSTKRNPARPNPTHSKLSKLLHRIEAGKRAAALQSAVSFRPKTTIQASFHIGELRGAFADYWQHKCGNSVPVTGLRAVMQPPVPIGTLLEFIKLSTSSSVAEIEEALVALVLHLQSQLAGLNQHAPDDPPPATRQTSGNGSGQFLGGDAVATLRGLVDQGRRFSTVYADPPWPYKNTAFRGAAANHYSSMSIKDICAEPVRHVANDNAHLHLWTTNSFLREAFEVMTAWGFQYKSCFVWVKPQIGLGNYWRVSHEYLLLGVRGRLRFNDRSHRSWQQLPRSNHSRKPGVIRSIIEAVSPGPYLEMYGREQFMTSQWTVYGNQIDRRWF